MKVDVRGAQPRSVVSLTSVALLILIVVLVVHQQATVLHYATHDHGHVGADAAHSHSHEHSHHGRVIDHHHHHEPTPANEPDEPLGAVVAAGAPDHAHWRCSVRELAPVDDDGLHRTWPAVTYGVTCAIARPAAPDLRPRSLYRLAPKTSPPS